MIATAQHLDRAERALRQIVCDLIVVAPSSPSVYATVLELAEVGKAMQERIRVELKEAEGEAVLCIGANI